MDREHVSLARKAEISSEEWQELVNYCNKDELLALAARLFYLTNTHNTFSFDYFVPGNLKNDIDNVGVSVVYQYINSVKNMMETLSKIFQFNDYYSTARLLGVVYSS